MKKILSSILIVMTIYIITDWFSIKGNTKCIVICVDGAKVLVCRDNWASSQSSPSSTVIGVCK